MAPISYSGYRFPRDVIQRAVWMFLRFTLSFRDVEDLLAERGIEVSYETIRRWVIAFGPAIARRLRAKRFLSMHAATYNVFTVLRHLTTAPTHRLFRAEAFATWRGGRCSSLSVPSELRRTPTRQRDKPVVSGPSSPDRQATS